MDLWQPTTSYFRGRRVLPLTSNGWRFRATLTDPSAARGTTGDSEPIWPKARGATTAPDGDIVWLCEGFEPYTTDADTKARLTEKVFGKLLDDNRDGFADLSPADRLHIDGSVYVNRWVIRRFRKTMPFARPFDEMLVSFALDAEVAYGAQRHPRIIPGDAKELFRRLDMQLDLAFKQDEEQLEDPAPTQAIVFDPNAVRTIIDGADGSFNGGDL